MALTYRLKRSDGTIQEGLTADDLTLLGSIGEIRATDMLAATGSNTWTLVANVKGLTLRKETGTSAGNQQVSDNPTTERAVLGWRGIVQECRHSVPLIESPAGQGSGLLISGDGFIVTNHHVVGDARTLVVTFYDGTKAKAVCVHRHSDRDLAMIRAAYRTKAFFDLQNRIAQGYETGDEVLAIGHPRGLTFTSTRGIISECRRTLPNGEFVQTDVAINPGNSGGPLLDQTGKLVGLNTQVHRDSQGLGFAIPAENILEYVREVQVLIQAGEIIIPSDEDIAALEQLLSSEEVFEAAAKTMGFHYEPRQYGTQHGWEIITAEGNTFGAVVNDKIFHLLRYIGTLGDQHLKDARLLAQILRWQENLMAIRFTLDDENNLSISFSRSSEDLDISEAQTALFQMAEAVDSHIGPLRDYLD